MAKLHRPIQLELSNGIPVIFQHTDAPVSAIYWWNRVGSADEGPGEEGFAHFLEHMLFKDTAAKETGKASTGQMARQIESLGGEINAYTSFDQTVYHVTCAAHHWERVLDVFGAMAKPQRFLKSDFEREREVILEELRKNEDSPHRQLFQALFSATFKKHPYGRPVIGFSKTLKAAKVAKLEAFYKRNYVSSKMGLILVGPLDDERRAKLLKQLERYYGSKVIARREGKAFVRPQEPSLRKKRELSTLGFDVKTPTIAVSFRAPELKHADTPSLDLLAGILGMGELSRLYQRLFYKESLVTEVSGGLYVPSEPGMFYFQAEMDELSKLPQVCEALFEELALIRKEGATQEEISRVLVNSESERLYATQTADGQAGRLGFLQYVVGDLDFDRDYIEDLRAIDSDRIKGAAARYFDPARMSIVLMHPKEVKGYDLDSIYKIAEKHLGTLGDNQLAEKAKESVHATSSGKQRKHLKEVAGRPEIFTLPSGIQVVFRERPESHVMSIHTAVLGGLRLELADPVETAERDWGASYLMSLSWAKGTESKDAREIARIVEGSAAGVDGFAGRNTVGVAMTGLARDWGKLSELFTEVLLRPGFSESEFEHSKRIAEDSIRTLEDHSSQLCSKLFLESVFEKHPYGKLTIGSLESLSHIGPEKLKAFHRRWVRPERLTVSVVGAVRRSQLDHWLRGLEKSFLPAPGAQHPPELLHDEPTLKAPRWIEKNLGREQTHLIVGGLGMRMKSEERTALQLLNTLLGGQSGRLFIELREKKSLAYTVAPMHFDGVEKGYVGTYIACAPSKKKEAVDGIREVLEKLADKGPTEAEMKRAKEFFLGRRAMDLQSDSGMSTYLGLEMVYGMPIETEQELIRRIEKVKASEVRDVCRKYMVEPHQVTAAVG